MMPVTLLTPKTGAVTSPEAVLQIPPGEVVSLQSTGIAGAETATVQSYVNSAWQDLKMSGASVQLTASTNCVQLTGPLVIGVIKSATSASAGVFARARHG